MNCRFRTQDREREHETHPPPLPQPPHNQYPSNKQSRIVITTFILVMNHRSRVATFGIADRRPACRRGDISIPLFELGEIEVPGAHKALPWVTASHICQSCVCVCVCVLVREVGFYDL